MIDLSRRGTGPEILDSGDVGAETFAAVMDDLASVSRVMLAHAPTIGFLQRATRSWAPGTAISVLDVGSGEGDLLRRIRRWSDGRGLRASLRGLDLNPRSAEAARARTPDAMRIDYETGDVFDCSHTVDFVVSSLFTHHLTDDQVIGFVRWMEGHSLHGWFVNDLYRHRLAYHGFGVAARLARWHSIVREDGQMSVSRAFTPGEWRDLLARAGVRAVLHRRPMYRLCVSAIR